MSFYGRFYWIRVFLCLLLIILNCIIVVHVLLFALEVVLKWIHPTRGVKQGDPMSPVLFNIAMESILNKLDRGIGINLDETKLNHIAYADDVVLLAGTASGLQILIDEFGVGALRTNLKLNLNKTRVSSILVLGRLKKVTVGRPSIKYNNETLTHLGIDDRIKYLGIDFNPFGIVKSDLIGDLDFLLGKLKKSYLKPQQRLWVLKYCVFGRLAHRVPFTDLGAGLLNQLDVRVRSFVRHILHLPHDIPRAFFHSRVRDGGLGIFNFRLGALSNRRNRINNFIVNFGPLSSDILTFYSRILDRVDNLLKFDDSYFNNKTLIADYYKSKLLASNDGNDLCLAPTVPSQNNWLNFTNHFISGHDFINYIKLRINALPSRVRASRGGSWNKICSACNSKTETTYHVIQGCSRTHGVRIKRQMLL